MDAKINIVRISYSPNSSNEMSLWHKDGVYWNGQLHLTVLGNANIAISSSQKIDSAINEETRVIKKDCGDFGYLNSTNYLHKILPDQRNSPRIEISIPVNVPDKFLSYHQKHLHDYPQGCFIYTEEIDELIRYNKRSRQTNKWSARNTPNNSEVVYTSDFLSPKRLYFFDDYMKIYQAKP